MVDDLTDQEKRKYGEQIAQILMLKRDFDYSDRWLTTWGNKTDLGIFNTLARMVDDARARKELPNE